MSGLIVSCITCQHSYEPASRVILTGTWRICPACAPTPPSDAPTTRCEQCGRPLRAGNHTLCARCLGVMI
jgi:predicted amidophosphoribosyltransferase